MALPLEGIRVLEWAHYYAAPVACALLSDLGASVIKVESLEGGDQVRVAKKVEGVKPELPHGMSYIFEVHNRNKKSIVVDLRKRQGREVIYRLVKCSDVFVQNFRQGSAQRAGMDYETLRRYNPALVYCNCTGLGRKGPAAREPAVDVIGQARSGMMFTIGQTDTPVSLCGVMADMATGMTMAFAIASALYGRHLTGQGREIHTSLLGSSVWLQTSLLLSALLTGHPPSRSPRAKAPNPLHNWYRCRDGRWISLGNNQSQKQWPVLCKALGIRHLEQDCRFETQEAREKNCEELISMLDGTFATRTRDEWMGALRETGDIICSPVLDHLEVASSEQVLANDYLLEFQHPVLGKIREIIAPIAFDDIKLEIRDPAPQWGQHVEEVLREVAGYGWDDISKLKEQGVIL